MRPKVHTFALYDDRDGTPRISHDLRDVRGVEVALTTDPIAALLPVFRLDGDRGAWMGAFVERRFVTTDVPVLEPIMGTVHTEWEPKRAMAAAYELLVHEPTNPSRITQVGDEIIFPEIANTRVHLGVLVLAKCPDPLVAMRTTRSTRTTIVIARLADLHVQRRYEGSAALSSLALRLVDEAARVVQL